MREFGVTDSRRLDDRRPSFETNTADLGVVEFDPAFENVNELEFERVMVARLRNVLGASRANHVRADATARRGRSAKIAVSKERTQAVFPMRIVGVSDGEAVGNRCFHAYASQTIG